jgi:hypothetical protein
MYTIIAKNVVAFHPLPEVRYNISRMIFYHLIVSTSNEYFAIEDGSRIWSTLQAPEIFIDNFIHYCPVDRLHTDFDLLFSAGNYQDVMRCLKGTCTNWDFNAQSTDPMPSCRS